MRDDKTPGYIWLDTEFSSLELDHASLLQVAVIATDLQLVPILESELNIIIQADSNTSFSPWVKENLSPLISKCLDPSATNIKEADIILAKWINKFFCYDASDIHQRPILAGNSVHNDWFMIRKFLPLFCNETHYRLLDVSCFKTIWKDWSEKKEFNKDDLKMINQYYPGNSIETLEPHDALFDIKASIAELVFYKKHTNF